MAASDPGATGGTIAATLVDTLDNAGGIVRLLPGQSIEPLCNGIQIFPRMLEAINASQREVCFETFVYWSGEIARQFAEALSAAARRGVLVRVMLDWVGALQMDDSLVDRMRQSGADVHYFNALRWWNIRRFNHRTHRKILVVDGEVGFTGGVGIAQQWTGNARGPREWHDTHYRLEGEIVEALREAFLQNWSGAVKPPAGQDHAGEPARGKNSKGEGDGERALPQESQVPAAVISVSSPERGHENSYDAFRLAVDSARAQLKIITAYFVPDVDSRESLCSAALRGVDVQVMVPGVHLDHQVARFASRAQWGELLECGVKICVYERTMLHTKSLIVDDHWVIIGSANFDNRSFKLNEELNLHVFDRELVAWHSRLFEQDLRECSWLTLEEWSHRPWKDRVYEWFSDRLRYHL